MALAQERHQRLAELLNGMPQNEKTIRGAMIEAGYSPGQAGRGWAGVPNIVLRMLTKQGRQLHELGKSLSLEECRNLVIGRLADNLVKGKDGGVMSAKTMGSRRELNMFLADTQVGIIVLSQPVAAEKLEAAPPEIDDKT